MPSFKNTIILTVLAAASTGAVAQNYRRDIYDDEYSLSARDVEAEYMDQLYTREVVDTYLKARSDLQELLYARDPTTGDQKIKKGGKEEAAGAAETKKGQGEEARARMEAAKAGGDRKAAGLDRAAAAADKKAGLKDAAKAADLAAQGQDAAAKKLMDKSKKEMSKGKQDVAGGRAEKKKGQQDVAAGVKQVEGQKKRSIDYEWEEFEGLDARDVDDYDFYYY